MLLSKITINNFRLIVNAELDVHQNITLIVGPQQYSKNIVYEHFREGG